MSGERRSYTPEFKASIALEALKGKYSVSELSERHQLNPSLIHSWKKLIVAAVPGIMEKGTRGLDSEEEAKKDKRKQIERLQQENAWLQSILKRLSPSERRAAVDPDNRVLPLVRQVKLLDVNRSTIYYHKRSEVAASDSHKIAN